MSGMSISTQGVVSRVNDRHTFIRERVLALIARETVARGSLNISKADFARSLDCSTRLLDRSVTRLRREGLVSTEPVYGASGAQLGNTYRATRKGKEVAERFLAAEDASAAESSQG